MYVFSETKSLKINVVLRQMTITSIYIKSGSSYKEVAVLHHNISAVAQNVDVLRVW